MNNLLQSRLSVIICVSLVLMACGGGSSPSPDPSPVAKIIQQQLDDSVTQGLDSVIVYIDQKDKAPLVYSSGIRDRENQQPIEPNGLFKIASISKLFIAVAATKLVHQNDLSLDANLQSLLPSIANRIANSDSITLRHIIQHRSGVPEFIAQVGFSWLNDNTDIDQALELALDLPALFAPNSRYEYSNTNYLLLGKILDRALGYNHKIYIQDNILTPLQMDDTYYFYDEIDPSLLIKGYWDNIEQSNKNYALPGGSMISTAKDTAVFIRALQGDVLMNAQEKSLYLYFYSHSGWVPGYQSAATYFSDIDTVAIQFVSTTTTDGTSESIASANYDNIIGILRGQ